jgi:uncharacterized protein (TIGR03066 family)
MRLIAIAAAAAAVLVAALSAAPVPAESKKKPAELLVGKWRLLTSEGKPVKGEVVVEYLADGTLQVRYEDGGQELRVAVEGKYTVTAADADHPLGVIAETTKGDGKEYAGRKRIVAITADTLETKDEQGVVNTYGRVKAGAKGDTKEKAK